MSIGLCTPYIAIILGMWRSPHLWTFNLRRCTRKVAVVCKPEGVVFSWKSLSLKLHLDLRSSRFSFASSIMIVTRYGSDGTRIESRWGARFSTPVQTGPGAHPASYTMGIGSFLGVKLPGRGVNLGLFSDEVKERVKLYLYCPTGFSWPFLGWPLPLVYYVVHLFSCVPLK